MTATVRQRRRWRWRRMSHKKANSHKNPAELWLSFLTRLNGRYALSLTQHMLRRGGISIKSGPERSIPVDLAQATNRDKPPVGRHPHTVATGTSRLSRRRASPSEPAGARRPRPPRTAGSLQDTTSGARRDMTASSAATTGRRNSAREASTRRGSSHPQRHSSLGRRRPCRALRSATHPRSPPSVRAAPRPCRATSLWQAR